MITKIHKVGRSSVNEIFQQADITLAEAIINHVIYIAFMNYL